jgi:energy-converting hydrogenase B subunit D
MTATLEVITMVTVGVFATGVVLVRDPLPQSIAFSFYGLALISLFLVLQAPDVALSEIVVGTVAYPIMILLTLSRTRSSSKR